MPSCCNPESPTGGPYEELCVLAAIGEVNQAEFEDLQRHLADCAHCRALYADVCRISSADLGIGAAHLIQDSAWDEIIGQLDGPDLLRRFRDRANSAHQAPPAASIQRDVPRGPGSLSWLDRAIMSLRVRQSILLTVSAVALLAIVAASSVYWLHGRQLTSALDDVREQLSDSQIQARIADTQHQEAAQMLQRSQVEKDALQRQIASMQADMARLQLEIRDMDARFRDANTRANQQNQELSQNTNALEERERQVKELQAQLAVDDEQMQKQRTAEAELQARLRIAENPVVGQPAPKANPEMSESDARELLGARDLHIVDVYDVASSGNFRRVYGRVYYVEKKYFVFYAFNLDNAKGGRKAAAFQAWGFREADQSKPESLGLFYIDDAKTNRWALKVGDPAVLDHIDTVSVTVEPPGGSQFPRGHKLLYASLTGPPNHP
jgi:hypothetical protein